MKEPEKTMTKGNIIVQNLKIGDITYEFEHGMGVKSEVITKPEWDGKGYKWKSKNTKTDDVIDYYVSHGLSHYGPNLYDNEAYKGVKYI